MGAEINEHAFLFAPILPCADTGPAYDQRSGGLERTMVAFSSAEAEDRPPMRLA